MSNGSHGSKTSFLGRLSKYRPFSWFSLVYNYEKQQRRNKVTKQQKEMDYIQLKRSKPWFEVDGDNKYRYDYNLNEQSVVFDLGGYKGEFSSIMFNKYNCNIYVFEPVSEFHSIISKKFSHNKRVHPFCFGLANANFLTKISDSDNSSSVFIKDGSTIEIQLKDITEFIIANNLELIDLIKINIEGGEYDLLESLILNKMIVRFLNIQVQFHDFIIPDAYTRMKKIQEELSKTHRLTYKYEFIWENWEKNRIIASHL